MTRSYVAQMKGTRRKIDSIPVTGCDPA
jgi:hypothetical protein